MNKATMHENEIAKILVDCFYKIHVGTGPGLLESCYEELLSYELTKRGIVHTRQEIVGINYDGKTFEKGYRADIIAMGKVIVEIKSVRKLDDIHFKQLLTYMKLNDKKLGLLVNFNEILIKNGIHRIVNNL